MKMEGVSDTNSVGSYRQMDHKHRWLGGRMWNSVDKSEMGRTKIPIINEGRGGRRTTL